VTLDIEVAGAVAAASHIVIYFAPNTTQGLIDAIQSATSDKLNSPSVLSMTWGNAESEWTRVGLEAMNRALEKAALRNVTVITGAGDSGVTDRVKDGRSHVDFPSSSPWVLAVGGTRIMKVSGNTITSEVAWNDGESAGATGGGVSDIFELPNWQTGASVPPGAQGQKGRGIPDVAANASPLSGFEIYFNGQPTVVGGTGAAAQFWAGLIAIVNQGVGHNVGYINPVLYTKFGPAGILRNITEGDNSVGAVTGHSARTGWNAVTGWGSPDGRKLLKALQDELASQH
jgi:kumamolisin